MVLVVEKIPRKIPEKQLLKALVYEEWGDKVVYYKGYEEVLRGEINLESVMSCSDIQGVLVAILTYTIASKINRKKYLLATNEVGLHLKRKNNLGNDLVIYEREKVKTLRGKYFNVPPKIAIEVDIKADLKEFDNSATNYIVQKSQKLLDFGTERVLWILTDTKKTFIMEKGNPTSTIVDWSEDVLVMEECVLNISQLLEDEEIDC
jgi:Uma2 family endonuclease